MCVYTHTPFQEYFLFEDKKKLDHFILQIIKYALYFIQYQYRLENDKNCNTAEHCLRFPKAL